MLMLSSEMFAVYRRLLGYLRPHRLVIVGAAIASAIYASADAAVPLLMKAVIERLSDVGRSTENAWQIPLLIAVVFPIRGSMDVLTVYGLGWVGRSVIRDLRRQLFAQYLGLPARYFDQSSSGVLISKLTYNTEQVAEAISTAVVVLLRDTLAIIVLLGMMLYLSWQLTLLIGIVAPTVGFLVGHMTRAFRRYSARIQNSMGDVTRITDQSLHGQRVVKIFEGHEAEQRRFDDVNQQNFRLNMRLTATRAIGDALTAYAVALGVAAVIYAAFSDWMLASLDAALFVGFITAMGMLLSPLKRLINVNVALQRGIAAAAGLFETIDEPVERDTGTRTLERARGEVEYRHVTFQYDAAKGAVIDDLNLVVPAGKTVALVGQSGSGKTTLVSLLARFYDTEKGLVLLDGHDVREYRLRDLRRQISLVSQDVVLFDDTIANNIAYGALAGRSREDVERAARAAHVMEFATELPDGLDTRVGERGAMLSGGQRQRVAIARALLKDAPVLILDEATSALDSDSERKIQAALSELMLGRTTLVIAHRLSTIEKADQIVVMKDGEIVEIGRHEELVAQNGYYSTLHRMQFAG
jgi:subfamily B ATP-binding cassette protein MsbA